MSPDEIAKELARIGKHSYTQVDPDQEKSENSKNSLCLYGRTGSWQSVFTPPAEYRC